MWFTTLSLVVFLPLAVTQQVIDVQVGAGGSLIYNPDSVTAAVGDTVNFHYYAKNHTATQSTFSNPCSPLDGGFNSGFMPVAENATDTPIYSVVVQDTTPMWVYCAQTSPASHCGQGMVFAVNAGPEGSNNSFREFQSAALQIGASSATSSTAPSGVATAAYGGVTIPPAPTPSVVTQAVTVGSSAWTTVYSSYPNSPAPTPASLQGNIIKVIVGGTNTLNYTPPWVQALPRDVLLFEFHQKNHSVMQSSFGDPCRPTDGGIISNFYPVAPNATEFPTLNITVNDTAPIWFYCGQQAPSSHCGAGMVFAVNPDQQSSRNFGAFQQLAEMLNGTATATATASGSSKTGAAAPSMRISVAGVLLAFSAPLAYLL